MTFSLIIATIGRPTKLIRLLRSLETQNFLDIELIIIDQSQKNEVLEVLIHNSSFPYFHIRSKEFGLSKARNLGLQYAHGELFAFPDDDCWYPDGLLCRVNDLFLANPNIHGFSGRVVDSNMINLARYASQPGLISPYFKIWERTSSVTLFLRKEVIMKVGIFDETLGVGSKTPWGGGEDIDYPIRAIKNGLNLYYDPGIYVYHPGFQLKNLDHQRAFTYGAGIGRVWKKHKFPLKIVGYYLLRPAVGSFFELMHGDINRAKYYIYSLMGRLSGWLSSV